jgi:hypothetical protein
MWLLTVTSLNPGQRGARTAQEPPHERWRNRGLSHPVGLGAARLPGPRPRRPRGRALLHRKEKQAQIIRKFLVDYMDRRAQAKYAAMDLTSKFKVMLEEQFSSRGRI